MLGYLILVYDQNGGRAVVPAGVCWCFGHGISVVHFSVLVLVAHRAGIDQVWLSSMISMAELYLPQPLFYTKAKTALVLLVSIYLHILLTQTNLYFTWFGHKPI